MMIVFNGIPKTRIGIVTSNPDSCYGTLLLVLFRDLLLLFLYLDAQMCACLEMTLCLVIVSCILFVKIKV